MNYWDVPERPLEPPEEKPVAYCGFCDSEIYVGDTVYRMDGGLLNETRVSKVAPKLAV